MNHPKPVRVFAYRRRFPQHCLLEQERHYDNMARNGSQESIVFVTEVRRHLTAMNPRPLRSQVASVTALQSGRAPHPSRRSRWRRAAASWVVSVKVSLAANATKPSATARPSQAGDKRLADAAPGKPSLFCVRMGCCWSPATGRVECGAGSQLQNRPWARD